MPPSAPATDAAALASPASKDEIDLAAGAKDIESNVSSSLSGDGEEEKTLPNKDKDDGKARDQDDGHVHDHHGHPGPTPASLIASAVVCFVIYFVFCIVFSSVVWDPLAGATSRDDRIDPPFGIPQGVGIYLVGIAVGSAFFAMRSGCRGIVAGPDLLPVVFFAEAGASVLAYLAGQQGDGGDYGGGEDCGEAEAGHRLLGDAAGVACRRALAASAAGGSTLPPDLLARVVPTTLVAMMIGNVATGLLFYGLGRMRNTASVIGFIPASVVAGFLTCIGYKVRWGPRGVATGALAADRCCASPRA